MAIMTEYELKIYNEASAAAVLGNRGRIARALRAARRRDRAGGTVDSIRYGAISLTKLCIWNVNYVGWPVRIRPNKRYL